jgi:DNA-binding protein HU-beta
MNKIELVRLVARRAGMTQKDCGKFLDVLVETIGDVVAQGENVLIMGFGSFEPRERRERRCLVFGKDEIIVPAKKTVCFRAGKTLKDAVN